MLLYLHGFRSSPRSFKARLFAEHFARIGASDQFSCPQLPASPAAAARLLVEHVASLDSQRLTLVGSSLGGYYATWLAERLGCRAVLLNPAVHPERDLAHHLGVQKVYYSEESVEIRREFLGELEALWVEPLTRLERYFLVAAKGDELLDWREMSARYHGARQWILEGSDHGLSQFREQIGEVLAFAS
jgi:predicted esterase YcpF (UPF0227 family)